MSSKLVAQVLGRKADRQPKKNPTKDFQLHDIEICEDVLQAHIFDNTIYNFKRSIFVSVVPQLQMSKMSPTLYMKRLCLIFVKS